MNVPERLEKLRRARGWTWLELGKQLELSRTMIFNVRKGTQPLGVKSAHRLAELERDAGLPLFLHETPAGYSDFDLKNIPLKTLDDLFKSLGKEFPKSQEPERSRILNSLNKVHDELKRREISSNQSAASASILDAAAHKHAGAARATEPRKPQDRARPQGEHHKAK